MAGAAVGLWRFERHDPQVVRADAVSWLRRYCEPIEISAEGDVSCWIDGALTGAELGEPHFDAAATGRITLSADDDVPASDDDYSPLARSPVQGSVLWAGSAGRANQLLLGHVARALAQRWDALVDFDGLLLGRDPHGPPLLRSLPGALYEVPYATDDGQRLRRHVGDSEFLAAWLRHPRFHLVE
ncbi:hypothetical protein CLV63_101241 [Murinocardiopsis flavida]|uniref:Uncharacterized protein n=1 Tax=Murinocardiopsis flavida TaxID=645275 RepID=A0A2P8DU83_9ACTN|nr:DUF6368 family protein [Murinocardiopsis flavida]PSL00765.1 hypothetical protein CLV63_101241 [Murinocardiopsis flavida]